MYYTPYNSSWGSTAETLAIAFVVILILSLVGAIAIYIFFLSEKNEGRFSGFVGWLYNFLSFKKLMLDTLLKILYLFFTLLITLYGIVLMFESFIGSIFFIILGNIIIRFIYEFSIMKIIVCKNTSEINSKLSRLTGTPEPSSPSFHEEKNVIPKDVCPACGHKIKSTAKFCPFCGTPIEK